MSRLVVGVSQRPSASGSATRHPRCASPLTGPFPQSLEEWDLGSGLRGVRNRRRRSFHTSRDPRCSASSLVSGLGYGVLPYPSSVESPESTPEGYSSRVPSPATPSLPRSRDTASPPSGVGPGRRPDWNRHRGKGADGWVECRDLRCSGSSGSAECVHIRRRHPSFSTWSRWRSEALYLGYQDTHLCLPPVSPRLVSVKGWCPWTRGSE